MTQLQPHPLSRCKDLLNRPLMSARACPKQELYSKIVAGKIQGRSFAFNDDGYKNMNVADEWQGFAGKFLPGPSPYGWYKRQSPPHTRRR